MYKVEKQNGSDKEGKGFLFLLPSRSRAADNISFPLADVDSQASSAGTRQSLLDPGLYRPGSLRTHEGFLTRTMCSWQQDVTLEFRWTFETQQEFGYSRFIEEESSGNSAGLSVSNPRASMSPLLPPAASLIFYTNIGFQLHW